MVCVHFSRVLPESGCVQEALKARLDAELDSKAQAIATAQVEEEQVSICADVECEGLHPLLMMMSLLVIARLSHY